jgi:nitrogen fixation protein NifZ
MMDIREPKYQWGQPVISLVDLFNDGSYPDCEPDTLLVAQGASGEIVQVGHHVDANVPVYLVEFGIPGQASRVIGCVEDEIQPVS